MGEKAKTKRVVINIDPEVRDELNRLLYNDERFRGIGYSEFIRRAIRRADTLVSEMEGEDE